MSKIRDIIGRNLQELGRPTSRLSERDFYRLYIKRTEQELIDYFMDCVGEDWPEAFDPRINERILAQNVFRAQLRNKIKED